MSNAAQLENLQKIEAEAKRKWADAVRKSAIAKAEAKRLAEEHSAAQQAVIEELKRLVGEASDV